MEYPNAVISDQGSTYIEQGQMWMYRNNLVHLDEAEDGDIVQIVRGDGTFLALGFVSLCSHIAVRILSHRQEVIDDTFFAERIRAAWEYRKTTQRENLGCIRLIYGEADGMPGLIVDRYEDILVTQISCTGMEKRREKIYAMLKETLEEDGQHIRMIYERNDLDARTREGLTKYKGIYSGEGSTQVIIQENGLKLYVDVENGQKTGYFLDQKMNRYLVRQLSYGKKVLDCFSHTGGFALNAALGGASFVRAVDLSQTALNQARANAELNGLEERMAFTKADVFDYLEEIKPGEYDLIILDPPAFTKNRRTADHAYQGYKRINKRAMEVLRHGGYLATCSCSRYMEIDMFEEMLKESAREAGVTLRQISVTQQNSDHPILWNMTSSAYLKFYIFQIL